LTIDRSTIDRFDLIAFDLDGTLIDSRRDLANAVNALLVEHGAAPLPEAQVGRMVGDGAATLVARAFQAASLPQPPDALARFLAIYAEHLTDHTTPYDGIERVLTTLGDRAALGIVTNKPIASTRTILERLDLARWFPAERVYGGDGPFPRKPDPASLRHLMQSAGIDASRMLFVGDSLIDWRTARAASTSICVARYGFGFDAFPADTLTADDLAIDAPDDLLRL
jgi:phosphoglycolate phosphatase